MVISIGILAHNEEKDIAKTICDIGKQTLLENETVKIEIHVVANGCSDATVDISKEQFAAEPFRRSHVTAVVHDIARPGKSNAWNEFVHQFASRKSDYVYLLDADIRIPEENTFQLMFDALIKSRKASIAVDESVKDLTLKPHKTVVERLILAGSGAYFGMRTAIAGGLYCARFPVLSGIWMPIGLPGEDGFLRAMIFTANFTEDENLDHVVFVSGARHIFEFERRISDVFHHNIRLTIGTAINVLLFKHFRELGTKTILPEYIKARNNEDPDWINKLIKKKIEKGNYFIVDRGFLLRRAKWFASLPILMRLRKMPIFILAFLFDLALFFTANHLMRRGAGAGYW